MTGYPARCKRWARLCSTGCLSPAMRRCSTRAAARAESPKQLIERVPRGRVIAVDMSESMVAAARERLGPGADIRRCRPAGAGARRARRRDTFDRDVPLGRRPRRTVSPPARSPGSRWAAESAQCGGEGNITELRIAPPWSWQRDPYAEHFRDIPTPVELREHRRHRGAAASGRVRHRRVLAQPAPTEPEHPREFLSTIVLGPHVQHLPEHLREPFMDEVHGRAGRSR